MVTLGSGKADSLIDREMLDSVEDKVDLGDCNKLYIDNDIDLDLMEQKVDMIKNTDKVWVPWPIYKFVLKHTKSTGDVIGYEGKLPFEEATPQEVYQKKDMTIKNLDSVLFQRVKAQAATRSMTVGDAINKAMEQWLERVDQDYVGNKRIQLLHKLEKLSDKRMTIGMDNDIFERIKKSYEKEIDKLDHLEGQKDIEPPKKFNSQERI